MSYQILPYSYSQAKKYGVEIYPSHNPSKKIDVFKDGEFISSIGAIGYMDYPYYIQYYGKKYADERRRLYHIRHRSDNSYSSVILW